MPPSLWKFNKDNFLLFYSVLQYVNQNAKPGFVNTYIGQKNFTNPWFSFH